MTDETTKTWVDRWKSLAELPLTGDWDVSDFLGFFQYFRPHGQAPNGHHIAEVFAGVPPEEAGADVLERLLQVFRATSAGYADDESAATDWYFVVRRPPPFDPEAALGHAQSQLDAFVAIAKHEKASELVEMLSGVSVKWLDSTPERGTKTSELTTYVYDVVTDYRFGLEEMISPLDELREAFYSIANDPYLRNYVMWPLLDARRNAPLEDPFRPHFWLWSHGLSWNFTDEGSLLVFPSPGVGKRC